MMAYEQKPGDFTIGKNYDKKKEGANPKWPDYKGQGLDLDGNKIWVSCWLKDGEKGKFFACNFKLQTPKASERKSEPEPKKEYKGDGTFDDMTDDAPF